MKQIFENFGVVILTAAAAIMILAFVLGHQGISKIGDALSEDGKRSHKEQTDVLRKICERPFPVITDGVKKNWKTGEAIPLPEIFLAEDADGNCLELRVKKLEDKNGTSCMEAYDGNKRAFIFERPGAYTVTLEAEDAERKSIRKRMVLIVDSGGI